MADEEFTAEETAALEAMKSVTAESVPDEPEVQDEPPAAVVAAPEPAKAEADKKPPEGYVPHGALHAEREERKKADKALADAMERIKALEAVRPAEKAPEVPAMPDPILEPEKFAEWQGAQHKANADKWAEFEAGQKAEATMRERASRASAMEAEFAGKTPDYADATRFLVESRQRELAFQGFTPERAQEIMRADANALFDNAVAQGQNPAAMLYEIAKMRGFAPKAPNTGEADKLKALAAAQENNATLSTTGGEAQSGGLTYAQMAEMSEEEIAGLYASNGKLTKAAQKALGA